MSQPPRFPTYSHAIQILVTVRMIVLLKKKGFKEAPPELSCTEIPRRQDMKATSLYDADLRSHRQDGASLPISASVSSMCSKQHDAQVQLDSTHKLGEGLNKRRNHSSGFMLLAAKGPFVKTRLGLAPVGSPLSYQQALLPGGFVTWLSFDILPRIGKVAIFPEFLPFDVGALVAD
ncbi:hypothetical protein MRX96_007657 [Rhipicephalus microplus]